MTNENRNVFAVDGAGGFVIAVLLLLGSLAFLTYFAAVVQKENATKFL